MKRSDESVDMIHGPLAGKIIIFALPVALSSMLQQLFNSADTAVVGRFSDANALAAVGTNGEIVALIVSLSAGLSVGANVLAARCIGSGRRDLISSVLHTSVMIALLTGILICVCGQFAAYPLLRAIHASPAIIGRAVLYLRIYLLCVPFLVLYDFGSAVLRAKGDSRRPFIALAASGLLNITLNLVFVIAVKMDVAGVAAATVISTACSMMLVFYRLSEEDDYFRFSFRKLSINSESAGKVLMIGIPAALQGAVFCAANIFVQSAVNSFGAVATAGSAIAVNFEYFSYYLITSFGQAATTFTSQNSAAGKTRRCRSICLTSMLCSAVFSTLVIVPIVLLRTEAASFFSTDRNVITVACIRIMCILVFEPLCCLYEIPAGVLRGLGHSLLPSVLTVTGICLFRIVWICTVFRRIHTYESLFIVFPVSWILTSCMMTAAYIIVRRKHGSRCTRAFCRCHPFLSVFCWP